MNSNEDNTRVKLDSVNTLLTNEIVNDTTDGVSIYQMLYMVEITDRALFSIEFFKNIDKLIFSHAQENTLTGILCIGNGYFFQYIEGSEESLTNLKNQFLINSGYININLYEFSKIDGRKFPQYQSGSIFINNQTINTQLKCFLPFQPQSWSLSQQLEFVTCVSETGLVKNKCNFSKNEKLSWYLNLVLKLSLEGLKQPYLSLALVLSISVFILMLHSILTN